MKVWMVDPDSGWRYGFPKPAPEGYNLHDDFDFHAWLVDEGYPQEKIDYWLNSSFGYVPCRMWEQEIEDEKGMQKDPDLQLTPIPVAGRSGPRPGY